MINAIKKHLSTILAAIAIISCMVIPVEAKAEVDNKHIGAVKNLLPTSGETVLNGKYQVYMVDGDLEDISWAVTYRGHGDVMMSGDELVKGMPFVDQADVTSGKVQCGFICKVGDKTIGINPSWKKVYYPAKKKK